MKSNGSKKALVTGATGFIGGRLTERLLAEGISVRALVREFDRAAWLAARGAELVAGDVTEPDTLAPAFESCQLIFHCAALMHDAQVLADEYRRVNVKGVEHMLEAASRAEVERFIYVSSIAVYGISPKAETTESEPHEPCGIPYIDTKIEAEEIAFRYYREKRLPLVVVRPANVYGPRSRAWTVWLVEMIKAGKIFLIDDGRGMSNEVYIDNLVEALWLAARSDRAVGEAFIISDGAQTNWREFLGHYARMLGCKLQSVPRSQAVKPPYNLSLMEADMWTQGGSFDLTKARTLLGYAPQVSLAEGMRLTEQWLRAAGHI